MSIHNVKSEVIVNRDAAVISNPENTKGLAKFVIGAEQTLDAISDAGSQHRLISIPSNARVHSLEYARETLGTSTLDVAVWYPTVIPQGAENAPAASLNAALVSSSAFVGGLVGGDAALGWTDAMGVFVTPGPAARTQPLWQLLGLSDDPGVDLDLGFTVRVATAEQGYIGMRASYAN